MPIHIEIPITHTMIYGVNNIPPQDYLCKLDRSLLIKLALLLLKQQEQWSDFRIFCENYFSQNNSQFVNDLWDKYKIISAPKNDIENIIQPKYSIISKHSCLELLRISFSLPIINDGIKDTIELEKSLFLALLAINEISDSQYEFTEQLNEPIKSAYSVLLTLLPYNDFTNTDNYSKFMAQCKKAEMFFEFCKNNTKYSAILDIFLKEYYCKNWEEYVCSVSKLFILSENKIILDPTSKSYYTDSLILSNLSININQVIEQQDNLDYRIFRSNPIIQVQKDQFIVIYNSLCVEKIYNSLIFSFKDINETLEKKAKISNIFQDYTSNFSEEYLFYTIIRNAFVEQKKISMSGFDCRIIDPHGEPDYYIRNWDKVFLFEFKDVMMNADIKTSSDYIKLKDLIEDKLVCKKKSGKDSAIGQLVNNIARIQSGKFPYDDKLNSEKVKIYPILVVGDAKYVTPGMSCILNDYFKQKLEEKGINKQKIKDLILIDIDTLILYQDNFTNKITTLKCLSDNYYKYLKKRTPYTPNKENILINSYHHLFSFSHFIQENVKIESDEDNRTNLITKFKKAGLD